MQCQHSLGLSSRRAAGPAALAPHPRTPRHATPNLVRCWCVAPASSSSSSSGDAAPPSSPRTQPPAPAAAQPSSSSSQPPATDWSARRKQRVVRDLVEASKRLGPGFTADAIAAGVSCVEQLLPGLQIDVERLKASDWARLVVDVSTTANKVILLKSLYPRADITRIVQLAPNTLLNDAATLQDNARQVKQLLATAKQPDELLSALPSLLDPHICISVIVTVNKWYFNKRDPIEVLEADPDLVRRAQECDMPWEPVYVDADGKPMAPSLNYHEKRTDWQRFIDQTCYKQASGVPFEPVWVDPVTGAWEAPGFNYLEKRAPWQKYLDDKNKGGGYLTGVGEAVLEEQRRARQAAEAAAQAAAEAAGQAPGETAEQAPAA